MNTTRILIVEDDPLMAEIISAIVRRPSIQIHIAATMGVAKMMVADSEFCAVLLDLMLPDSTLEQSLESVQAFKQMRVHSVVIITASPINERLLRAAQTAGADDIIGKDDLDFEKRVREIVR